jgi:hypothetical protein
MLSTNEDQCEMCAYIGVCLDSDWHDEKGVAVCNDFKLDTLNPKYWDCECNEQYIHSKLEESCTICGAQREEMPDSRQREIEERVYFAPNSKEICCRCNNPGLETLGKTAMCACCEGHVYFSVASASKCN